VPDEDDAEARRERARLLREQIEKIRRTGGDKKDPRRPPRPTPPEDTPTKESDAADS